MTWPAATIRHNPGATGPIAARALAPSPPRASQHLRLFVRGTDFQLKVWEALICIPQARLTTYADLGERIGRRSAARAVGNTVVANPISYLIPCHRVIRGVGVVGEYRWGSQRKQAMIAWEPLRADDILGESVPGMTP